MDTATDHHAALWDLVQRGGPIDATALCGALRQASKAPSAAYRTRLLMRASIDALDRLWGATTVAKRIGSEAAKALQPVRAEEFDDPGFNALKARVMETTKRETVLQFLRDLGSRVDSAAELTVGGATALILRDMIARTTEDIDVVDEVPAVIRAQHALLHTLADRYGLSLTHFQSHYLPDGWAQRLESLGRFGSLEVRLVDATDIFVGKLFSRREKDLDDLRALARELDRERIEERVKISAQSMLADPNLQTNAQRNWYIVYGDNLPG